MCNKELKAQIAANETIDGTSTYCTLPGWGVQAERVKNSRTSHFTESCWCCGRAIDDSKGGVWYVHLRISGGLFRADSEMTEAYEQSESQGWFAVGNACRKKYPGYCRQLS